MFFIFGLIAFIINFIILSLAFWFADGSYLHLFFGVITVLNFCLLAIYLGKAHTQNENMFASLEDSLIAFDAAFVNDLEILFGAK